MFIKQLFNYSKLGAILFSGFIALFIFINYKWGATFAPASAYGMYSKPYQLKDTATSISVYIDGRKIDANALSFADNDIIQVYPDKYLHANSNNQQSVVTLQKLYGNLLNPLAYQNTTSETDFWNWYLQKLRKITKANFSSVNVRRNYYYFAEDTTVELAKIQTLYEQ
jgi:hypothetical protein